MRTSLLSAAVLTALSISTAALAQSAPAAQPSPVKAGQWVRSSDGAMIGRIEYLDKGSDGAVKDAAVIYEMRMVHIPGDSLSAGDKGVVTSLTKADVRKLK
jgi:hypothetical protein